MEKVIVIGCPGSGKTVFSKKLNSLTNLPLYHLDAIWHKQDKTHITREEFDEKLLQIFNEDKWIIDGNYQRTIEMRIINCDTIFLFDLPVNICLQGVRERIGKERNDLPWIETEVDEEFKKTIENFSIVNLPIIYELLKRYQFEKHIVVFKSREDVENYLKSIK